MLSDRPPQPTPTRPSSYIPTLDGWRALSIAAVLVHHLLQMRFPEGTHPPGDPLQLGVAVFFALSGLLITTLLLDERRRSGAISLRGFYRRRVFRILPPALAYLAVLLALTWRGLIDVPARSFFACLTFWRYAFTGDWYTGHFWSLSMEEQFYLVWPAILVVTISRRGGRLACGALLVLFTLWASLGGRFRFLPAPAGDPNYWALFILWGALAALLIAGESIRARLRRWSGTAATLLLLAITLVAYFHDLPGRRVIAPLAIALLLLSTVLRPESLASRFLELPALRWLGRLSYSLYLWQQLFLVRFEMPDPFHVEPGARPYVALFAALACAVASRTWIEKPFIALGQRLGQRLGK